MSLKSAAYDRAPDDPVLVTVAEGLSDVGRLLDVLSFGYARCEHARLAAQAAAQVRRHSAGRKALALLRAHGGPDLLASAPDDGELQQAIRRAILNPGALVRRDTNGGGRLEQLSSWQMRAVLAAILPRIAR